MIVKVRRRIQFTALQREIEAIDRGAVTAAVLRSAIPFVNDELAHGRVNLYHGTRRTNGKDKSGKTDLSLRGK